jgi:hypothetical protein
VIARLVSTPNDRPGEDEAASSYRLAFEDTVATMRHRARLYRVLAASVLLIPIVAIGVALAQRSIVPLRLTLSLVVTFAVFRCADLWFLWRWEKRVVSRWVRDDLVFAFFRNAVESARSLPQGTVGAMLELLPADPTIAGPAMGPADRRAIASAMRVIRNADSLSDAIRTIGRCLLVIAAGIALVSWSWRVAWRVGMAGLGLELVAFITPRGAAAWWRRRGRPYLTESQASWVSRLDWRSVPTPPN